MHGSMNFKKKVIISLRRYSTKERCTAK